MRMPGPGKAEVDALVFVTRSQHAIRDTAIDQKTHAVTLEDARSDRLLDLEPDPVVNDDQVDPGQV
jgi:hypothetical protein